MFVRARLNRFLLTARQECSARNIQYTYIGYFFQPNSSQRSARSTVRCTSTNFIPARVFLGRLSFVEKSLGTHSTQQLGVSLSLSLSPCTRICSFGRASSIESTAGTHNIGYVIKDDVFLLHLLIVRKKGESNTILSTSSLVTLHSSSICTSAHL